MTTSRIPWVALLWVSIFAAWAPALAGHGVVHIPSFYPQEFTIDTIDPATAAAELEKNTLHAYIGTTPHFAGPVPKDLQVAESLDGFLLLTFNPVSESFRKTDKRCSVARAVAAALDGYADDITSSAYPITPFHPDYVQHLDRIVETKASVQKQAPISQTLKFRATGSRLQAFVRSRWSLNDTDWDAELQEVSVGELIANPGSWLGPPWMKEGWFQAYRLLAPAIDDPETKQKAQILYQRLARGEYHDLKEQFNLQRQLLASLTGNCNRAVVGYTLRREYYNDSFDGVEKITLDAQLGLNSPVFVRSVKLKDFPWNGWLRLGTKEAPHAAWNPVAGFTDLPGRLMWFAVGDPALLPIPYNGSWMANRVEPVVDRGAQRFQVPRLAVIPQAGTGALAAVGPGKKSTANIAYRVSLSVFHDGLEAEVADLLYPYVLAYRWGVKTSDSDSTYDPVVDRTTALMREQLVGVRVLRVEETIEELAPDITVPKKIVIAEVYTNYVAPDSSQMAELAPPWSSVPWHVLVLMEEAVKRGLAAFSKEMAARRGLPWLDLARDPVLQKKLRALIEEFEENAYRPEALKGLVSANSARVRWSALKKFANTYGHLLVTNGPYRLTKWSQDSAVLGVVRELTYPHGVGSFDHYAYPPRAVITQIQQETNRFLVDVDVERVVQEQRSYRTHRERLMPQAMRGLNLIRPDSRYLVLGPDGSVQQTGTARLNDGGRFVADLPLRLPRGQYTFIVAIELDGNSISPATRIMTFEAKGL